jgi:hypothetical protein
MARDSRDRKKDQLAQFRRGGTNGIRPIDYKTHILIGVRANGMMSVICHWPYVPRQAEVEQKIEAARDPYLSFALCTPTSILPGSP